MLTMFLISKTPLNDAECKHRFHGKTSIVFIWWAMYPSLQSDLGRTDAWNRSNPLRHVKTCWDGAWSFSFWREVKTNQLVSNVDPRPKKWGLESLFFSDIETLHLANTKGVRGQASFGYISEVAGRLQTSSAAKGSPFRLKVPLELRVGSNHHLLDEKDFKAAACLEAIANGGRKVEHCRVAIQQTYCEQNNPTVLRKMYRKTRFWMENSMVFPAISSIKVEFPDVSTFPPEQCIAGRPPSWPLAWATELQRSPSTPPVATRPRRESEGHSEDSTRMMGNIYWVYLCMFN